MEVEARVVEFDWDAIERDDVEDRSDHLGRELAGVERKEPLRIVGVLFPCAFVFEAAEDQRGVWG